MGEWINGKKIIQAWKILVGKDIYSVPWTPYHDTSTIVGWSSYTNKVIEYKKIGKFVFVNFNITGTSDANQVRFSLPYTEGSSSTFTQTCWCVNSGARAIGWLYMTNNVAYFIPTASASSAGWVTSGDKRIAGQFCYEAI